MTVASGNTVTFRTAGAATVEQDFGLFPAAAALLADPNLAFLFLSLGTLAIIYELASPGDRVRRHRRGDLAAPRVLRPVGAARQPGRRALLALAAALFVAELFAPGVGVFAAGGTVALVLAGLFLFDGAVGVDPAVLVPAALVVGGGSVLAGRLAWRARRAPSVSGRKRSSAAKSPCGPPTAPIGQVHLDGAWWTARSRDAPAGARADGPGRRPGRPGTDRRSQR